MSAAGLLAPAPAPAGAPPAPEYYPEEDEELESAEDDERSCRGRESDEDTEDASETDLAKHDEEDYVEMKEQMYQDKLASLKRQLQQLQEGTLQEYQKRMKKLDQQYKERIRNAELFLQLETEQVERNYIKEKKAAVKEFEDKKVELKENLIAELEEKKKMIENEKLTMELTGDSMEVKPIMTRKLRRRPNDPVPIPDKRRKPAPAQLNYLLTDEQIMEDLRTLNKLKSPKRPASPSSPEHLPATPAESPAQRFEARIEDGKLYYDKRWYHKSQAIYLESKDNQKLSCVISSVGANEIWVRKTSDSTKMRIYLGQLQRGLFVIRRRCLLGIQPQSLHQVFKFPLRHSDTRGRFHHLEKTFLPWGLLTWLPTLDGPPPPPPQPGLAQSYPSGVFLHHHPGAPLCHCLGLDSSFLCHLSSFFSAPPFWQNVSCS
ncbi:sin3 histone deacetylase corepressor complex component SDS3 isoform X1 [Lutra lutra]|uniref:sin3 histone deacetylase corepressor complex component SDS3 isoform X1 n=1 Tax=Lutra lutra TaxID=9657 RepID=UPI001FD53EFF|nr:sin3 histone deacetylase corepressor complex component SDS3 isoform X1 [Lutra lutra]